MKSADSHCANDRTQDPSRPATIFVGLCRRRGPWDVSPAHQELCDQQTQRPSKVVSCDGTLRSSSLSSHDEVAVVNKTHN